MLVFTTVAALHCYLRIGQLEGDGIEQGVGLVPTMGALHAGHLTLLGRARQQNSIVIVSIFVNPLQFGPSEDFQKYPRQLEPDRQLCEKAGVDAIFVPTAEEMGMNGNGGVGERGNGKTGENFSLSTQEALTQVVPPESMTSVLCGRSRVGHFQGVATIVTKLLNLVQPTRAYFGQKDAQQLAIIRRLVADLNLPVEIVACPTVRESSGLALSSRNQYLTAQEKEEASVLYRSLRQAERAFLAGERSSAELIALVKLELAMVPTIELEYVESVDPTTLIPLDKIEEVGLLALAARLGSTRLIDNILLRNRQPIVAIDGPAGAGKSTVARQVAQALGLLYLDTGAMYRAVTWLVLQSDIPIEDEPSIAEMVCKCEIILRMSDEPQAPVRVWINSQEVTQAIRSLEVTSQVSAIAAQLSVRQELVKQQQLWGEKGGIVVEGRDIGTHVFPDAELKIFLTASVHERAKRRQQELKNQGEADLSLEQMEQNLVLRDWKDSNRDVAPLQKAPDSIEILTDGLSIAEVTDRIVSLYKEEGL
ncbi:bifunctional pantoate--beta-alanine ligase/(d)CMP kinase [Argonema galeatum]|uniref:bifunctional pantoate--beta-alanine ligase/(d)CMP kinase n=1 Tax=Argonema galeatum TaxID=2942762 RepID=UPI00201308CB|nr:bifunctional pantoate--beta-alanine ligase/(d)CMP kinase [Argonema galeatum A003/A1]